MNLYGAFECAFHMFACIGISFKFRISMLVCCMLSVRLNDEMKSLDNFHFQVSFYKWYLFKVCFQVV